MNNNHGAPDDEWYKNVIAAAKHLSFCSYFNGRPALLGAAIHSLAEATVTLEIPKTEFVQNRAGTILVDVCADGQYEVLVETINGLTCIKSRKKYIQ